jgi:hypothetical protein
MSEKYHRFSDFADTQPQFEGEKKKIPEILNSEILIINFRVGKSKYKGKKYLTLHFEIEDKKYITFTGSNVLIEQAQEYAEEMPYFTTIIQRDNYYTMT